MQLKTILCKFWRICATGNALIQLETILCEFGRICATGNALMQLETILCEFGRISATGNALMQLETILCKFEQISATGNAHILLETILCEFGQIRATGNPFQWLTVGRNSILNFPAKIWTRMCRALLCCDDSSSSQGQSGKRLLLAFRGHPVRSLPQGWLLVPQGSEPTPWTRPQMPPGPTTSSHFDY